MSRKGERLSGISLGRIAETKQVIVACRSCHSPFPMSPRTLRDQRSRNVLPICGHCKSGKPIVVTAEMRAFWIDRFTIHELVEIAEALWGPRETWR